MFIRRTRTRADGEYFTFRLVRSERIGDKVRQRTLLNLGRHFDVAQGDWRTLCRRIDEILAGRLPPSPDVPRSRRRTRNASPPRCPPGIASAPPPRRRTGATTSNTSAPPPRRCSAPARSGWSMPDRGPWGSPHCPTCSNGRAQRPGRTAGHGLRNHGTDAPVPRIRCPGGPPRGDRAPPLRPCDGAVRPAADRHPVRSDQYLLRGRGGSRRPGADTPRTSAPPAPCSPNG